MKDEMLKRIREAMQSMPAALPSAGSPAKHRPHANPDTEAGRCSPPDADTEAGRLFPIDLDRSDRINLFTERARSSGAEVHRVDSLESLQVKVASLLEECTDVAAASGVTSPGGTAPGNQLELRLGMKLDRLIPPACTRVKFEGLAQVDGTGEAEGRAEPEGIAKEALFKIDGALTGVNLAVAETGSILLGPGEEVARLISLVSEVHIALIWPDQIVADLLDLAPALKPPGEEGPGNMTLISGPSKTADIEIKLVVGVHGPARLHMIMVDVKNGT